MIFRRMKARVAHALDRRFSVLDARIDALQHSLAEARSRQQESEIARWSQLSETLEQLTGLVGNLAATVEKQVEADAEVTSTLSEIDRIVHGELRGMIRAIASEEPRNRRALFDVRERSDYELAFDTAEPLVSITIPTTDGRSELLLTRAIASALNQTYENIEVVVVGDAVDDETREAVAGLDDPRVRFYNLTNRVVHADPHRHWLTAACMPRNEAHRQARGLWIADLDDDDALRPDAVSLLLDLARSQHVEVVYGKMEQHHPNGDSQFLGGFPPRPLQPDWKEQGLRWQPWQGNANCGALAHSGLRIFGREHVAAELGMPGDFFRMERMLRAGVTFAMLDQVVYDYYPSLLWEEQQ